MGGNERQDRRISAEMKGKPQDVNFVHLDIAFLGGETFCLMQVICSVTEGQD